MRFDTKEQAVRAAAKINQMFAKRGHSSPVVQDTAVVSYR